MKFTIDYNGEAEKRELIYRFDEYSFDMYPWLNIMDIELTLNYLSLTVVNNTVIQLGGFCGLNFDMNSNIAVPEFLTGKLKVEYSFTDGFAYAIKERHQPVFLNIESGWVCIGDPLKLGNAVEFIQKCVAVLSKEGELLSLWLKPKSLSEIEF